MPELRPDPKAYSRGDIARCRLCALSGITNTNVVGVATLKTPHANDGDFLCLMHNHKTAIPYAGTKEGK